MHDRTDGPTGRRADGLWERRGGLWLQMRERAESCLSSFKQLTGMPDYAAYVRHLRLMHPAWPIPSAFFFW